MYKKSHYDSPLGRMVMVGTEKALSALWFEEQDSFVWKYSAEESEVPVFSETRRWLDTYFGGKAPDFMPSMEMGGTPFQRTVWEILRQIRYGKTTTYGAIAKEISNCTGRRVSAQAVGGAVGKNPICILVPCHRVIGADGSLTGYAGGLWRKRVLLALERNELIIDNE